MDDSQGSDAGRMAAEFVRRDSFDGLVAEAVALLSGDLVETGADADPDADRIADADADPNGDRKADARAVPDHRVGSGRRKVLGLAGPPAAGKSTLARHLVREIDRRLGAGTAAYVPLDGFHLSDPQLVRIGRLDRKGAPDTFDAWGYAALLGRLVGEPDHDVYVPDYDRTLHAPVAARHVVSPAVRLIVTEGNYLAADAPGWREARHFIDLLWYVEMPDSVRETRLLDRQRNGGKAESDAQDWVFRSDRPNGEWVKPSRARCDRVVVPTELPDEHGT